MTRQLAFGSILLVLAVVPKAGRAAPADEERKALHKFAKEVHKVRKPEDYEKLRKEIMVPAQRKSRDATYRQIEEDQRQFVDEIKKKEELSLERTKARRAREKADVERETGKPMPDFKNRPAGSWVNGQPVDVGSGVVASTGVTGPTGRRPEPSPTATPVVESVPESPLDGSNVPKELEFRKKAKRGIPNPFASHSPEPEEKVPTDGEVNGAVGGGKAVDTIEFERKKK